MASAKHIGSGFKAKDWMAATIAAAAAVKDPTVSEGKGGGRDDVATGSIPITSGSSEAVLQAVLATGSKFANEKGLF